MAKAHRLCSGQLLQHKVRQTMYIRAEIHVTRQVLKKASKLEDGFTTAYCPIISTCML